MRTLISIALVLTCLALALPASLHPATSSLAAPIAKKVCKTVKRHGKKKKVCHAAKPRPTSTPVATATPTATPSPTPTPTMLPVLAPNPLAVSPRLDASHAATATIGPDGGSLTATAADGTTYALTVPADALAVPTSIIVTPISAIDGLPFSGGLVDAVKLGPEGLQLLQPVTLTVVPAHAADVSHEVPFLAQGDGSDFHLYPQTFDPKQVVYQLRHFSMVGTAQGSPAEIATQLTHQPADGTAQLEQLAGAEAIAKQNPGNSPQTLMDLELQALATAKSQISQLIQTLLDVQTKDDDAIWAALLDARGKLLQIELLGLGDDLKDKIGSSQVAIIRLASVLYSRTVQRCTNHDINQVPRIIAAGRTLQLMGVDTVDWQADLERCLRFSLDFTVSAKGDYSHTDGAINPTTEEIHFSVDAGVTGLPLRLQTGKAGGLVVVGQGSPAFTISYSRSTIFHSTNGCVGQQGATIDVQNSHLVAPMTAELTFDWPPPTKGKQTNLSAPELTITPADIEDTQTTHSFDTRNCQGTGYDRTITAMTAWYDFALERALSCTGGYSHVQCPLSLPSASNGVWQDTYLGKLALVIGPPEIDVPVTVTVALRHTPGG